MTEKKNYPAKLQTPDFENWVVMAELDLKIGLLLYDDFDVKPRDND